ncbi:calretinin-like [Xenia sp. Carnegie-2017]|uniref:calretinin-like n=1 Tax=Xenia sp. Carnegie-2017 TaxID=2897299 RepID=UPI001F03D8AB|nr:calretinin-like [Xenia sp. Carnegie-2017]
MSIVKQFKGNKILTSAEFVTLFKKYDKDGNGFIEAGELDSFLRDLCSELGSENELKCGIKELKELVLTKYDVNSDGKLSMDEMSKILPTEKNFLMNFRKNVKLTSVEFMEIWFHYDLDKSGFLEGHEIEGFIYDFLKKAEFDVSPTKIKASKDDILNTIDSNKDGKISLTELAELLPAGENFFKKYEHKHRLDEQDFNDIFAHYDKDKSGQIEEKELLALLKDVMERDGTSPSLSDLEDCKVDIMKIVDSNKDGKVSRDELALLLSAQ